MSNVALKPQMNTNPAVVLNNTRPASRRGEESVASKPSDKSSKAASAKKNDASFSQVLEKKSNTPSRSNQSPVDNKNLNRDAKIETSDEPASKAAKNPAVAETQVQKSSTSAAQVVMGAGDQAETQEVSKETALQVFLTRMQSELGVKPEQVVEAFSQLDIDDLAAPPEQTIEKVIGQLNLPADKEKKAEDMYAEMLALSATATMSEYLKAQNQTAKLDVMSPKEATQKQIQKDITSMSNSFFAQPVKEQNMQVVKNAKGAQAYGTQRGDKMAVLGAGTAAGAMAIAGKTGEGAPLVKGEMTAQGLGAFELPEGIEQLSVEDQKSILNTLKKELSQLEMMAPQSAGPEAPSLESANKAFAPNVAQAQPNIDPMAISGSGASADAAFGEENESGKEDLSSNDRALGVDQRQQGVQKGQPQFAVQTPKAEKSDIQNNVQDVISQAQILVKKGGGEMKVKMSPEGMGDVALKVVVENGQVNVEMIASNSEAKKLLERGMEDLKANLASHKLHVEQIKIESSQETSNHSRNMNQDDGQRQFQQKFLHDFREQNNAFRREIYDIGPARKPSSQIADQAANASFDPSRKRADRRLDLVA